MTTSLLIFNSDTSRDREGKKEGGWRTGLVVEEENEGGGGIGYKPPWSAHLHVFTEHHTEVFITGADQE